MEFYPNFTSGNIDEGVTWSQGIKWFRLCNAQYEKYLDDLWMRFVLSSSKDSIILQLVAASTVGTPWQFDREVARLTLRIMGMANYTYLPEEFTRGVLYQKFDISCPTFVVIYKFWINNVNSFEEDSSKLLICWFPLFMEFISFSYMLKISNLKWCASSEFPSVHYLC